MIARLAHRSLNRSAIPLRTAVAAAVFAAAVCVAVAMGLLVPAAHASVTIKAFNAIPSTTQAGAHPDFSFEFELTTRQSEPTPCSCSDAKDITAHLPAGLIGNPRATPLCDIAQFATELCPVDSQLGVAEVIVGISTGEGGGGQFVTPVYNLVPPPDQPALLGFKSGEEDSPTFEDVSARTDSDYGLDVKVTSIEHFFPLAAVRQVTWGVPAAPVHDFLRFALGQYPITSASIFGKLQTEFCSAEGERSTPNPATVFQLCSIGSAGEINPGAVGELPPGRNFGSPPPGHPVSSNSPTTPFLQNPTTCGDASLVSTMDVLAYDRGETHAESPWPATTGCAQLTFNPSQAIAPTTEAADSPSGAEFRLTVPQFESSSVPSPSELEAAFVTLPRGFSFAPNVTNGKETCSDAQAKFGTTEEAQCPEDSKIGTLQVETPVLPGPLHGAVYLGEPKPGNRFRLVLAFNGFGVHVKLAGTSTPDPATGQIHISFQNLPQAPFADFNMHIFGSERGPLDTPTQCGTYEVESVFTPWDSALLPETSRQFFNVTEGPGGTPCPDGPRPFHPGFQAASASNAAGAHTAFSLDFTRNDGEQNLESLKVTTPPGFAATLKGVSYCPDAAIAAAALESHTGFAEQATPSCPSSSQIGEFTTGAGPGSHPLYLPGKVYLAGPYQGAPLSFVFITPAVSAGYDLGNVVVREGLDVNPETAQVSTAAASLPQIFQGIPLRLRQIMINLNRPNFALNPTNCDPLAVRAEVFGDEGAVSTSFSHFQVANCASLSFKPKLALRFSGSMKRSSNPALTATLTYPGGSGYANIASTQVTLPSTELIDNAHIRTPCTRVQFAANACPAASVIGFAKAETPLLEKPLEGPVYLRSSSHKLPDVVAALKGQIDIELDGRVDSIHKRLRTSFEAVPDAPVSKFTLSLDGGKKGLLESSENLCAGKQRASVRMVGQNGKVASSNQLLQTPCKKAHGNRRRAHTTGGTHR
jgi:hypothetical protein